MPSVSKGMVARSQLSNHRNVAQTFAIRSIPTQDLTVQTTFVMWDAIGLGSFVFAGCGKAIAFGLAPPGAILLGVMTAIGSGILCDMMAAEVPRVLNE